MPMARDHASYLSYLLNRSSDDRFELSCYLRMKREQPQAYDKYQAFLQQLKERIRSAQIRAAVSVNSELILLYWSSGNDILERQKSEGWGTKVIERFAADLTKSFAEMTGFGARNLKYMRAFAEAYPKRQFVQQVVAQIPWGHNARILDLRVLKGPEAFAEGANGATW